MGNAELSFKCLTKWHKFYFQEVNPEKRYQRDYPVIHLKNSIKCCDINSVTSTELYQ